MKRKIFQSISITSIVLVAISYFLCSFILYNDLAATKKEVLRKESTSLAELYNSDSSLFLSTNYYSDSRITLINQQGVVVMDSANNSALAENHANRPEFQQAQVQGFAQSNRYSDTLNEATTYYAIRLDDRNILRLSTTSDTFLSSLGSSLLPILFIFIGVFIVSVVVAKILTKKIIDPINHLNLDSPLKNKTYPELQPLLENMDYHNRIRKEFSANVSHELKTPLTSISGYAEIMVNNLQGNNTIEFSQKIVDESKHLLRIIEDIIKLSKLDEGSVQLDFETIDYKDVIETVVNNLGNYASKEKISIILDTESIHGLAIRQIIYEILYNLVQNAIKYNNENGHVWISTHVKNEFIEIVVKDDGIGILDDDTHRIFERFYRSDKSHSRKIEGTGLGLAIVKHGVDFHKGSIEVSKHLNSGTKFTLHLPR